MIYFGVPFATSGDKTTIPDSAQPSGAVSYTQGFPVKYSTSVDSGGLNVPRNGFNELFYQITSALQSWQLYGLPEYFAEVGEDGDGYSENAVVRYSDGVLYLSLEDDNVTVPGTDPTKWEVFGQWLPLSGGKLTGVLNLANEVTVTFSAGTLDIAAAGSNLIVTAGTGTITSFGTGTNGMVRMVRVNSALTITNGGGITCPGGANIVCAVGDQFIVRHNGTAWTFPSYQPISGNSVIPTSVSAGFSQLTAAWASNTTLTITAAKAITYGSGTTSHVVSAVSGTINCATTGANGLDAGSLANNTWYYGYIIYNPTTDITALLASTSASSPTLPSGYTYATKACVAFRTDGSATIIGFKQLGADSQYVVGSNLAESRVMASGGSGDPSIPTWTATAVGSFVPSIASKIKIYLNDASGSQASGAAPNNSYGSYGSATNAPPMLTNNGAVSSNLGDFVLESSNIYYYSGGAGTTLYCMGFTINL